MIGWLQEEVLLSMYARFAMQPAVIPDAAIAEPEGQEHEADEVQRRRRRLTAHQEPGVTAITAQDEEEVQESVPSGVKWKLAELPSLPRNRRQRRQQASDAVQTRNPAADTPQGSGVGQARGRSSLPAARRPLERRSRTGWRYRRRKDAFEEERRAGRQVTQFLDAAEQHTAGIDEQSDPTRQQSSSGHRVYHRRRQRQQPQELRKAAGGIEGGGDDAGQLPESLYPDMPPPMFAQNAGADARR